MPLMNDPIDLVRAANPVPQAQPREEDARRRMTAAIVSQEVGRGRFARLRRRLPRARLWVPAVAVLLIAGGTAEALGLLNGTPSAAPNGTLRTLTTSGHLVATGSYSITAIPDLSGGAVGWCFIDRQSQTRTAVPLPASEINAELKRARAHIRALLSGRVLLPGRAGHPGQPLTPAQRRTLRYEYPRLRRLLGTGSLSGLNTTSISCSGVAVPGRSIIAQDGGSSGSTSGRVLVTLTSYVFMTTRQVAAVRVSPTLTILTRADKQLPNGYRIAIAVRQTESKAPRRRTPSALRAVQRPRQAGGGRYHAPTALGYDGRPIPTHREPWKLSDAAVFWQHKPPPKAIRIPPPKAPPSGACEININALHDASPFFGEVVKHIQAFPQLEGTTFLSCANIEFAYQGEGVTAALLVDAQHPGARPGPLPNATEVARAPETFNEPIDEGRSQFITGKRVGGAWLLVQASGSIAQRIAILNRLGTCIRLSGAPCPPPTPARS
jgi:hypothetical protein